MRKIVLVLAVLLLAAPTWAAVSVDCVVLDVPGPNYAVAVEYQITGGDANDANNIIRAFGIRVDVNNGAVISNVVADNNDYYIFPGSIDINSNGDVNSWGSAVAEGGNGSAYMILEMGSLYAPNDLDHPNKPPQSGTLCTFETGKECVVTLTRDTARGGVVMEDGSDSASLSGCTLPYDDCLSLGHADWSEYDSLGRPNSWCYPRQCHGDGDNAQEGDPKQGYFYVANADLQLVINGWKKAYGGDPTVDTWIAADYDHAQEGDPKQGYFRVANSDLQIVIDNWMSNPDPNCNP